MNNFQEKLLELITKAESLSVVDLKDENDFHRHQGYMAGLRVAFIMAEQDKRGLLK